MQDLEIDSMTMQLSSRPWGSKLAKLLQDKQGAIERTYIKDI